MNTLTPITHGMTRIETGIAPDPSAWEVRRRLNRAMSKMARDGINFTQELIDAELARIKSEVAAA